MVATIHWEQFARATAHPLQVSILELLTIDGGRTLSPTEMSVELQVSLQRLSYHVRVLFDAGLIERADQRQVRGATEFFYRLLTGGR